MNTVTYTQRHIANDLGLSITTVAQCLNNDPRYSTSTREKVQAYAAQVGYSKTRNVQNRVAQANEAKAEILKTGVRPMTEYRRRLAAENMKMLEMRQNGMTNAMIAKKTGLCLCTVEHRIGHQPEYMTAASHKLAGEYAKRKKVMMAKCAKMNMAEFNKLVKEAQKHIRAINEIRNTINTKYPNMKPNFNILR